MFAPTHYSCRVPRSARRRAWRTALSLVLGVLTAVAVASVAETVPAANAVEPRHHVADLSGCAGPHRLAPGTSEHTTTVGGVERTYSVNVPAGYSGQSTYPLILAFHGHAEPAATFARFTGLAQLPAIVVYPEGLRGTDGLVSWQGAPYSSPRADDIAFTGTILREMRAAACIDSSRTYAAGRSNGGGLVAMLACRLPSEFAAYAVVSGAFYDAGRPNCPGAPPASIIDFHGTADRTIHYDGGVRHGGAYAPVMDWLSGWAARDGCLPQPLKFPVNRYVTRIDWPICGASGHEITHYRVNGGAHVWPGSTGSPSRAGQMSNSISATSLIWQFFTRHTK